ncbi:hypothetical protein GCM10009127_07450 [Alteraurantiacibacter aestuarii]
MEPVAPVAPDMIAARITDTSGFAKALVEKATALARAHAQNQLRASRADPARWRNPRLLWPLFTKDR